MLWDKVFLEVVIFIEKICFLIKEINNFNRKMMSVHHNSTTINHGKKWRVFIYLSPLPQIVAGSAPLQAPLSRWSILYFII